MERLKIKLWPKITGLIVCFISIFIFAPSYAADPASALSEDSALAQAREDSRKAETLYQEAVRQYQDLIRQGKGLDKLHLELGQLYDQHGESDLAAGEFRLSQDQAAKRFLAPALYKSGNFTDALDAFNKNDFSEDDYLYYYGLTCEKLNLYDRALAIYAKIKSTEWKQRAAARMNQIEKQAISRQIKDVSPQVYQLLSNAPSAKEYPQAGALILLCDEKIEVTKENTEIAYLHYVVKILNERGKENFAETQISYDSTDEKVELEYARTIKPDGTVAEVGIRHIRDVSKYMNFPLYSNARVFIISFPEIAEGSAIEYKVKVLSHQLLNKKEFVVNYPLQSGEPIIAANFAIDVPAEKILHIKTLNERYNDFGAELRPEVQEREGRRLYRWRFKNIPQIIPESNMPAQVEINPTLLVSTFSSWQEIYDWWWPLAKDKIKADAPIKEQVKDIISNADSPEAKLKAIYNFCAQKIRYVAVEYGEAGYEPHPAADILKNKYGDCKDQAILLVTMLKEAGFCAWPVLIATQENYNLNSDFPSVIFNHCIAAVSFKDQVIFLDPTAETASFGDLPAGDQARRVFVCQEDGYKILETPLYPPEHNLNKQELEIQVNPDETISAHKTVSSRGIYDQAQRYWLLYTQPELVEEALKEKIQEFSIGAQLEKYNIENRDDLNKPIVLQYSFSGPEYFTAAGSLRIMPQLASFDTSIVAKDRRRYAIEFPVLEARETQFAIFFPQDFVIRYIPQSIKETSPWFDFAADYSQKENRIYFRQSAVLKKTVVSDSEYSEFKKFCEALAKKIKQRIVLERGG
jgi:hypothetical protein